MPQTKIATCCYCGTRAALVLAGRTQHELACASCGAPLHDLKAMPVARGAGPRPDRPMTRRPAAAAPARPARRKKRKKKSLGRRLLGEAIDAIEDIFD